MAALPTQLQARSQHVIATPASPLIPALLPPRCLALPPVPVAQVSRHRRCRIRITVAERPRPLAEQQQQQQQEQQQQGQQGNKVTLMGVMVANFNVRLTIFDDQVEVLRSTALKQRGRRRRLVL